MMQALRGPALHAATSAVPRPHDQQPLRGLPRAYPILSLMVLFWAVSHPGSGDRRSGRRPARLSVGIHREPDLDPITGSSVISMLRWSRYELLRPILHAVPEVDEAKSDPGVLSGRSMSIIVFHTNDGSDAGRCRCDESRRVQRSSAVGLRQVDAGAPARVRRPERGSIYFDGQDLDGSCRRRPPADWRRAPERPPHVRRPLHEHRRLGGGDARRCVEAARMAGLDRTSSGCRWGCTPSSATAAARTLLISGSGSDRAHDRQPAAAAVLHPGGERARQAAAIVTEPRSL